MGIKHTYQSGTADDPGSEVSSSEWNADHTIDGFFPVAQTAAATAITAPSAGNTTMFARSYGGRGMFGGCDPSGDTHLFQPLITDGSQGWWIPVSGVAAPTAIGHAAPTATGTNTLIAIASTNRFTRMKRTTYLVTTAATTAVAGFRGANVVTVGGNAAGDGGFFFVCRWGPSTGVATATTRALVGLRSSAAPSDVNPSGLTSLVGMGWDNGDTNIQFMNNDAAGAATKTDLGTSFPRPNADNTSAYEIVMFSPPGTTQSVSYQITNLINGAVATGTKTTDLPTTTLLMGPYAYISVGGTSSVIGIALMGMYLSIGGV